MNNVLLENTFNVKEEMEGDTFLDDKVFVCETIVNIHTGQLKDYASNSKTQCDIITTVDNIKTELQLDGCESVLNNKIKAEDEVSSFGDIKIEFDNGFLFCDRCKEEYQDYCTKCGMLVHILNGNVPGGTDNKAINEIPKNILEFRDSSGREGIFALKVIPRGVKFGPFTRLNTAERSWKIKRGRFLVDDNKLKFLNWMWYVNTARSVCEQNLLIFQRESDLYYRSIRRIQEGEELLVYFGEEYEDSLTKDVEINFIPPTEYDAKDVFACTFCCLGFNTSIHLAKHKRNVCSKNTKMFSIEELTQCSFCQIHLDEREYLEYHKDCCRDRNEREPIPLELVNQAGKAKICKTQRRQMYECTECKYKTAYKADLESHVNQHYEVKMYKCEICNGRFKTRRSLKVHVENIHVGGREDHHPCYKSEYSEAEYHSKDKVSTLFKFRTKYKNHMISEHPKAFDLKCVMCDYKTNWKSNLKIHMKAKHLKEFDYKCGSCEFKTTRRSHLRTHIKTKRLNEFGYKCEVCDYKTNWKSNLNIHVKSIHLNELNYNCESCAFKTNLKVRLAKHVKTIHLKKFDYDCKLCEFKTNIKSRLEKHIKTKHLKEFEYNCELCEFNTNCKSHLKKHVKSKHLKEFDYRCVSCEYSTNQKTHLENHIQSKHLKEFDYNCESCEFKASNKLTLNSHIKTKHLKEFDFNCESCEFKTNTKVNLKKHIKTKHLMEFDYNCESCEFKTNYKSSLECHMKTIHLKKFDYNCETCEFKTNNRLDLDHHVKAKHLEEFFYNCKSCEFKTNNKTALEMHMKTKHLERFQPETFLIEKRNIRTYSRKQPQPSSLQH